VFVNMMYSQFRCVLSPVSQLFRCRKEKPQLGFPQPQMLPRYVVLLHDRLFVLEAHPFKMAVGIVKSNHSVGEVAGISYNKKDASKLTLKFRHGVKGAVASDAVHRKVYHFDDAPAFQAAITAAVTRKVSGKR
jgi:hypothetical protein